MAFGFRLITIIGIIWLSLVPTAFGQDKVSCFGEYRGYSTESYDGWVRSSTYLTMTDGVRIAIDIFRPTKSGILADEKLPVVWVLKRYQRASLRDGKVRGLFPDESPHMTALLKHGYVLASADSRGTGASFGTFEGPWTEREATDAFEITEWLASQPWSNGCIGMVGSSYEGTNQLMAASKKPPHLKAIMPAMAMFDFYDLVYPGGIFRYDVAKTWSELTRQIDLSKAPVPVDEDTDGKLLEEALRLRPKNRSAFEIVVPLRFRDDKDPMSGVKIYQAWQPAGFLKDIRESGVAVYLLCGWYDGYIRDGFLMFKNLYPRLKMLVADIPHFVNDPTLLPELIRILTAEQLRWFDFWLKGIENGIMQDAPIQFQTNIEAKTRKWRSSGQWPLPEMTTRRYFFHAGPSGSVSSVNDGCLKAVPPQEKTGADHYTVDYTTTSGRKTRWDALVNGGFEYPNMTANDAKGLTYTTEALKEDMDIIGHPILHIWITSTVKEGDFIAFLEEVDASGVSRYVSEGCIRASHRIIDRAPYDNLDLPYHRSFKSDVKELEPGRPTKLIFDFLPISNVFNAGNRLRITIVCADKDNLETPAVYPPPRVAVFRNAKMPSLILLPVVR